MKKLLLGLILFLLVSCTWPHDPMSTTEAVRDNVMIVGIAENPPWVTRDGDEPGGVEVELVKQFAQQMNADIEWEWGSFTEHMEALHQYELHLAIGDLTESAPNTTEIGLTQPFYETRIVVGAPAGVGAPTDIDDIPIGVIRGTAVAEYVRDAGAEPVFLSGAAAIDRLTALPHWRLDDAQLEATGISLHTLRHVMAVPPGENRWLTELDKFLAAQPPIEP